MPPPVPKFEEPRPPGDGLLPMIDLLAMPENMPPPIYLLSYAGPLLVDDEVPKLNIAVLPVCFALDVDPPYKSKGLLSFLETLKDEFSMIAFPFNDEFKLCLLFVSTCFYGADVLVNDGW